VGQEDFLYPRRRSGAAVDPAIRRMVLGAGGVSAAVIVVALVWSGVRGPVFGPVPVIEAPAEPLRVAPANPGGLTVPGADVQIMSGDDTEAPAQLAPAAAAPDITQLDQAAGVPGAAPAAPAPAAVTAPAAPAPVAAAVGAGQNMPGVVQLAAVADEPGALAVWNALTAKLPQLFAGRSPEIVPAVVNGQSVWRLRLGGFADAAAAKAFCAVLAGQGVACTVAAF